MSAPTVADRRARAYALLGVQPNRVAEYPKITPILRKLPGGLTFALECLRSSDSPDARRFLAYYDDIRIPRTCRDTLPLEAFGVACGLSASRIMGAIVAAAHVTGAQLGTLIAAVAHPDIVATSIEQAKSAEGERDREWQLKHMNFLPTPRGAQVNVRTVVTNTATADASAQSAAVAPAPEDTIRRLTDSFNGWRPDALTPGTSAADAPHRQLSAAPTLDAFDAMPSAATRRPMPAPSFASLGADYDEDSALDAELSGDKG